GRTVAALGNGNDTVVVICETTVGDSHPHFNAVAVRKQACTAKHCTAAVHGSFTNHDDGVVPVPERGLDQGCDHAHEYVNASAATVLQLAQQPIELGLRIVEVRRHADARPPARIVP